MPVFPIAWTLAAAAHEAPLLTLLALPPAYLATLPALALGRWRERSLGSACTSDPAGRDHARKVADLQATRRLEQTFHDRARLVTGLVAAIDLISAPERGGTHLLLALGFGSALLRQGGTNLRLSVHTDRIAEAMQAPALPPVRLASPAVLAGAAAMVVAALAALA